MPRGEHAATAATLADLRQTVRALRCAIQLLSAGTRTARERAMVAQMLKTVRRAEEAIRRLPSRWTP